MIVLELEKITDEMYEFLQENYNASKEQVLNLENDEDLRQYLLDVLTWVECDGIEEGADEETVRRGDLAADIITYISYKPPHDDEEYYEDEDE